MSTNVPQTTWQATDGLSEFTNEGANDIVDTAGNSLVDTTGSQIVDTGVVQATIPATVWEEDNSL